MLKKHKLLGMILIIVLALFTMKNYSQAKVTSTDVTVESGGTANITITTSTPVRSFKITLESAGGLTFQSASKNGSFSAGGSSNGSTINGVAPEGGASTTLATYTFKVPEVTEQKKYTIKFYVSGMDKESETSNTATVTVKPKVEPTPEPEPEPEPTPDPEPQTPSTPDTPSTPNYTVTEASGTFYITKSGVNLRTGPGTNYKSVGSAPANTEVQRTGTSGNWTRIKYNGQEVFISSQFLTATKPTEETDEPKEEDPQENTVVNQIQNEITNETTNEVTNEISSETSDENNTDDELQLKELKIEGVDTSSIFKPQVYEYNINVPKDVKKLEITATPNYKDATVEILGNKDFTEGENIVTIMIKSKDGEKTATYQLVVNVGAVAQSQSFPFNIVIYSIIAVIVIAIIVLIILIIRNRRNNEYNELDEDELSEEDNFNYYNNPMISNENEEEAPKSKRGKHF